MKINFSAINKKRFKIINFLKNEVKKGRYPTRIEIEEKFHVNLRPPYFSGIKDVYKTARVPYIRKPNPFIKLSKEKKLTKICLKLFKKLSYKIHSVSIFESKSGPDIILINSENNHIPVEIKAYHKYGKIGKEALKYSHYFGNEIIQLKRYIKGLSAPFGILVTSTNRSFIKTHPKNIKIILGKDLKKLLKKFNMKRELKELNWIRNTHVSLSKDEFIKKMRELILKFVKNQIKNGNYIGTKTINKKFEISFYSYFKSIQELYELLNIDKSTIPHARMGGNVNKGVMRKRILNYLKNEIRKDNYPTYKEIQKKFGCLPKLFFPDGIREMYKLAGISYNRKFANKTKKEKEVIKQKVIKFIRNEAKKNHYPNWREIKSKFKIGISNYFKKGMIEIYQMANIKLPKRQGLRRIK